MEQTDSQPILNVTVTGYGRFMKIETNPSDLLQKKIVRDFGARFAVL